MNYYINLNLFHIDCPNCNRELIDPTTHSLLYKIASELQDGESKQIEDCLFTCPYCQEHFSKNVYFERKGLVVFISG